MGVQKHNYEQIVALYEKYRSQNKVARHLGMAQGVVSDILRRCGVHVGKGGNSPTSLPDEKIRNLYLAGHSTRQIASLLGLKKQKSSEAVRKRLLRMGVKRRPRGAVRGKSNHFYKHGRKYRAMHYHRRQSYEIAAICLGYPLPKGWVIHHMDENPTNNRPENLWLFPSQKNHVRYHMLLLASQREGLEVDTIRLAKENGAQALQRPPSLMRWKPDTNLPAPLRRQQKQVMETIWC